MTVVILPWPKAVFSLLLSLSFCYSSLKCWFHWLPRPPSAELAFSQQSAMCLWITAYLPILVGDTLINNSGDFSRHMQQVCWCVMMMYRTGCFDQLVWNGPRSHSHIVSTREGFSTWICWMLLKLHKVSSHQSLGPPCRVRQSSYLW